MSWPKVKIISRSSRKIRSRPHKYLFKVLWPFCRRVMQRRSFILRLTSLNSNLLRPWIRGPRNWTWCRGLWSRRLPIIQLEPFLKLDPSASLWRLQFAIELSFFTFEPLDCRREFLLRFRPGFHLAAFSHHSVSAKLIRGSFFGLRVDFSRYRAEVLNVSADVWKLVHDFFEWS